jgi:mono/diheme cytochrome c family protein
MIRTLILSAVSSTLATVGTVQAQESGDMPGGRQLALDVCAQCHAVAAGESRSPVAAAPSFQAIAKTPGMTSAALAFWLTAHSHPTMPMIVLSREEVRDVSAYILSLRD